MNEANFNPLPFRYNPETGIITRDGKPVGSINRDRYLKVQIGGVRVLNHRLAWRLHTGAWPVGEIDHIDGDGSNNRIANLRVVSSSQNKMNRGRQRNNTSGEAGACFDIALSRWRVSVAAISTKRQSWYASHKVSAILAARLIRRLLHGSFERSGRVTA